MLRRVTLAVSTLIAIRAFGRIAAITGAVLAVGCSVRINTSPMTLPVAPHAPIQPASVIAADVIASTSRAAEDLESQVPESFTTEEECVALGLLCVRGYLGREPIRGLILNNRLELRTTIHYQLDANTPFGQLGSCGRPDNPRRRADVFLEGELVVDPTWVVRLENAHTRVTARDECVMGAVPPIRTNRTQEAIAALDRVLGALPGKANTRLESLVRPAAASMWSALQTPIQVDDRTWVSLQPERFVTTLPEGSGESLRMRLALHARPRVFVGDTAPSANQTPLPSLEVGESQPQFRIAPHILVSIDEIERELKKILVNQEFTRRYRLWPDPDVRIVDVHIKEAAGDMMLFGVDVTGSVKGTLWFLTHVVYDQVLRRVRIQLIDYEVRTSNVLIWAASWLYP